MNSNRQPLGKTLYHFGHWRVSVLTPMLIRLEYDPKHRFEDRNSQIVINRNFPEVACTFSICGNEVELSTSDSYLLLHQESIHFSVKAPCSGQLWNWGDPLHNLGGTARTLDNAEGPIPLEDGLFSEEGIGVLEDNSCLVDSTDKIDSRNPDTLDVYLFLYGRQFERGLKDFYHLCGHTPLIPRYALGNWWSRFWPYTQQEYLDLMDRFEREHLPFSVSVLDMDWHLTRVPEGFRRSVFQNRYFAGLGQEEAHHFGIAKETVPACPAQLSVVFLWLTCHRCNRDHRIRVVLTARSVQGRMEWECSHDSPIQY